MLEEQIHLQSQTSSCYTERDGHFCLKRLSYLPKKISICFFPSMEKGQVTESSSNLIIRCHKTVI